MSSNLEATYIEEAEQYAIAVGCYFEWNGSYVRFKGGHVNYLLTYRHETRKWQCNCPVYVQHGLCPHSLAVQITSFPVPTPVVMQ
jgi:hypothetical protein